ncbi:MAG: type I methionyl aminopeptidase [Tissierellia bacterium]|nr:type I methionyl aminopeptidase [Tissierellia bacterium]
MITIKTDEQIKMMHESGKLLASVHQELRSKIKPGVTTWELDQFVEKYIRKHGGIPAQIGYQGYKYATCASVNDEICHGFPTKEPLKEGDIVTIDMVIDLDGYLSDSAWSYGVGEISKENQKLLDVTKKALYLGIEQAVIGNRLGDIGHAIQSYVEPLGYSVVKDFCGHGIGDEMHEDPQVLHYGKPGRGLRIEKNMVFTIEPMINTGTWRMKMDSNGWTARTLDGGMSAQYEHTLAITEDGPLILTEQEF